MLELIDIKFERDNKKILKGINLKVEDNKFLAITGPNGSGKSTLAKIIMGIEKPDSGRIIFNGKDITDMSIDERANEGISFAFQQPVKFKGITVFDLLKIASRGDMNRQRACSILSKVGLCSREYLEREVSSSLSGGELKRIEIASVIAKNSSLTVFDEPEAGIDLWSFSKLTEIFEDIKNIIKGTTIVISHQERILNIADEVVLIKDGKVENILTSSDIMKIDDGVNKNKKCCKF